MKRASSSQAITLAEILVCMGMMSGILGCLLSSSLALQKTLQNSERYATSYSDQHRLIDFIGRDLRRAVAMSATDQGGLDWDLDSGPVALEQKGTLTVTLPGYYQSNVPGNPGFDAALPIVTTNAHADYGTASGTAQPVTVTFRKIYVAAERCVCFVREEAGTRTVIVRRADDLRIQITVADDGRTALLESWMMKDGRRAGALATSHDSVMLRNNPQTP